MIDGVFNFFVFTYGIASVHFFLILFFCCEKFADVVAVTVDDN